jgi:hypothetical protein
LKTILDEGVPELLRAHLIGHDVSAVKDRGWCGIKNGRLLDLIGEGRFEAFVTADKRMQREQALLIHDIRTEH